MSLFTTKHYEFLVRFAAETLDEVQTELLAKELAQDNAKFNRARFMASFRRIEEEYGSVICQRIRAAAGLQ